MKIRYNYHHHAVVVQLVERLVANEKVAGSNPVCRSKTVPNNLGLFLLTKIDIYGKVV